MTSTTVEFAVTGATGELGGRVARRLARAGRAQRLVVHDLVRAPELPGAEAAEASYDHPEYFAAALAGVDTVFLVSAPEAPDRVQRHLAAVDAAVEAGVRRIVYLSFLAAAPDATFTFARDHFRTEEHIAAAGVAYTFLRPSLYLDLVPTWVGDDGVIRGPAGDGRVAWVSRDDLADVATAVLTSSGHERQTYDVTGPEAMSLVETAETLSTALKRPVSYQEETIEEGRASRRPSGAPDFAIEGWVTSYAAIATGEMNVVSDVVERIAGHKPVSLAEFLGEGHR